MPHRCDAVSHPLRACTAGIYLVICLWFSAVWWIWSFSQHMGSPCWHSLSYFYRDKSESAGKDIGIAAYYHDVRVITCFWRNSNQVIYGDDIGFFVVCFQIFSPETDIVPYLYRCWVWVWVNQIMTYQIHQLYLVVHYAESHVLGGQCCVKTELMLSTSIIAWSTGSRHLLCTPTYLKYQADVRALYVIFDGIHEVDHVVLNGATRFTTWHIRRWRQHPALIGSDLIVKHEV